MIDLPIYFLLVLANIFHVVWVVLFLLAGKHCKEGGDDDVTFFFIGVSFNFCILAVILNFLWIWYHFF